MPAMVVKFFLKPCAISDFDVKVPEPQSFNFMMFMDAIKACGHYCNGTAYVPYDQIAFVLYAESEKVQHLKPGEPRDMSPGVTVAQRKETLQ